MDYFKDVRWKQRFENYAKSYSLLAKYGQEQIQTELERAGLI